MNILTPFHLYQSDKRDFLNKVCSICLCTLFYPENQENDKFVSCSRLNCNHIFHNDCIQKTMNHNHLNCPECRTPITKLQNIDKSLELAIRNDAFDNGNVDPSLKKIFENTGLNIADYPYHKIVFERWRNERK
jgi:hypothetical protein